MKKQSDSAKSAVLTCETCGKKAKVPQHCGKDMHVENVDGTDMFVCWMGADCGKQEIPIHHGQPMTLVNR